MVVEGENKPFFFSFNTEIREAGENHKSATIDLIARNPMFYKKTLFRAFLNITKDECDDMMQFGQEYIDYSIMLDEYLLLLHAPFQKSD